MTASTSSDTMQHAETYRQLIIDNCALFKQVSRDAIMIVTERLDSGQIIACAMLRTSPPGRIVCSDFAEDPGSALRSLHDKTMRSVHGYRNMGKTVSVRPESMRERPALSQIRSTLHQQQQQRRTGGDAEEYDGCSETSEDPIGGFSDSENQSDDEDEGEDDGTPVFTPGSSLKGHDENCNHEVLRAAVPSARIGNLFPSLSATQGLWNVSDKEKKHQLVDNSASRPQPSRRQLPSASHPRPRACAAGTHQQHTGNGAMIAHCQPDLDRVFKPTQPNHSVPSRGAPVRWKEDAPGSQGVSRPVATATCSSQPFLQLTNLKTMESAVSNDFLITIRWKSRSQHRILERCKPGVKAIQEAVLEFCMIHSSAFGYQRSIMIPNKPRQQGHLAGRQDYDGYMAPVPNPVVHIGPNHSRLQWNGGLLRASLRSVSPGGNGGDKYDLVNYEGDDLSRLFAMLCKASSIPWVFVDVDFVRFAVPAVVPATTVLSSAPNCYPISE